MADADLLSSHPADHAPLVGAIRTRTIELISPARLIPSEDVDLDHAMRLAEKIACDGIWTNPIAAEEVSDVVMDGHHRLYVAIHLGLAVVPVAKWSYADVEVTSWCGGLRLEPCELIAKAVGGQLLPIKTTRHRFPLLLTCNYPLSQLQGASLA